MGRISSKIDIRNIISKHFKIFQSADGNDDISDYWTFFFYPILAGAISLISPINSSLENLLTVLFSVFIGLFLNLLMLLISFKPNENLSPKRLKSVKRTINETVISTIYTIFLSVIQLILILVLSVFDNYYVVIGLSFLIYSLLAHIFVVFLMILKRIYILYDSNS